ncbi:MAG TPA: YjjG family noncanonical pyrimidine nucleotidase [Bacteroidia bacterium]|nr:YjjG family noncanonical pyrimidine nucleotidase [Bacteroidia bacterium]
MKTYSHIFFDLDHTLWDLERNASETIHELLEAYDLTAKINAPTPGFIKEYNKINDELWELYRLGKIDRITLRFERFRRVFRYFGIEDEQLAHDFGNAFVKESPLKPHLIPGAREVLDYLSSRYTLHIITNGFAEAQEVKIRTAGIGHYFRHIINSEMAGYNKPDARIFEFSLKLAGAAPEESIMIGDHLEADIIGAKLAGIDQIYYNPLAKQHAEEITYEVRHLEELKQILKTDFIRE